MNTPKEVSPKIAERAKGLGTVTAEMIEQRARELAVISGRAPEQVTQADRQQARFELIQAEGQETDFEEKTEPAATGREQITATPGHRAETRPAPDEQQVAEELVREGIEEADHERMYEASKQRE